MTAAPTLELHDASLRRAGSTLSPALSFSSSAQRVGLVGDWEPWFQLLVGNAQLATGSARVLGCDLDAALRRGVLGFAACDPLLPASFTVTQYLQHAARLSHGSAARAAHDATSALDRYGLADLAARPLTRLALHQKRALGVALATLTAPPVVCLEAPLRGLDALAADYMARLCAEAARHSRVIISAPYPESPSPERALLDACDELFLLERGVLAVQGTPASIFAPSGRYSLTVSGENVTAFSRALHEAGCVLTPYSQAGEYAVELPAPVSTDLLLDTALDHGVVVLALEPVFAAL